MNAGSSTEVAKGISGGDVSFLLLDKFRVSKSNDKEATPTSVFGAKNIIR